MKDRKGAKQKKIAREFECERKRGRAKEKKNQKRERESKRGQEREGAGEINLERVREVKIEQ